MIHINRQYKPPFHIVGIAADPSRCVSQLCSILYMCPRCKFCDCRNRRRRTVLCSALRICFDRKAARHSFGWRNVGAGPRGYGSMLYRTSAARQRRRSQPMHRRLLVSALVEPLRNAASKTASRAQQHGNQVLSTFKQYQPSLL
jgi:hypothetical protein